MPNVVTTQLIVDSSGAKTGVAEFEAAMMKAKKAAVDGGEATASAFERAQARWTQSLAKTDPVIKAQIAMERDLARQRETNANAVKLGIATQDAANAQLDRVRKNHEDYIATIGKAGSQTQKFAGQTGLARHELINLSRQAQDVVVSLQGGQGIGTVFLQQGSQILDVLGTSQGGIRGALSGLGTSLRSVLTVGRLAFAGIATAAAGAAYATSSYLDEQKNVERSLIGAGRRSASSGDINRIADERSSATGLSVSETRQAALEFAKTGQIHSRVIGEMIETTKNFALVTGQSSKEAAASLAKSFSDISGIDALNKQFNFLDANSRRAIESLMQAGRTTDAAVMANERLASVLKQVEATQGPVEKGWTAIGNALSNVISKTGEYIARGTGLQSRSKSDQAAELRAQIENLESQRGSFGGIEGGTFRRFEAQIENLRAKLRPLEEDLAKIAQPDAFNKLSTGAQQAVSAVNPLQSQLDMVVGKLTQLKDAQAQGINVPGLQMAVTYYEQIAQQIQNQMQAQDALAAKYPGMTAEFAKQVESLEQQNRLLKARENGTEATVSAAIAYENAISAGATKTEAAAIQALTLKNNLLQAAAGANEVAQEMDRVAAANAQAVASDDASADARYWSANDDPNMWAGGNSGSYARGTSAFAPRQNTQSGSFRRDMDLRTGMIFPGMTEVLANLSGDFSAREARQAQQLDQWDSMISAQAQYLGGSSNNEDKIRGLQMQIQSLTLGLDENPANIWQIRSLERSIEELRNSVDSNTDALNKVTLNPLYTEGRSALQVGYMHAAKGLDFIAQGPTSGDQVHVPLKVNGGERVTVQTIEQQASNDNRKTTVVNNTINLGGGSSSSSRRAKRQFAQTYSNMVASLS